MYYQLKAMAAQLAHLKRNRLLEGAEVGWIVRLEKAVVLAIEELDLQSNQDGKPQPYWNPKSPKEYLAEAEEKSEVLEPWATQINFE